MKTQILILIIGLVCGYQSVYSQNNCSGFPATNLVNISTGFNDQTGTLNLPTTQETEWKLVSAPSGTGIVFPAPCFVITPISAWGQFAGLSQWISPFQQPDYNEVSASPFVFERYFCVSQTSQVNINFELMCDNDAEVFIDNSTNPIISATNTSIWYFSLVNKQTYSSPHTLAAGVHKIKIKLYNSSPVAMGFTLNGSVCGSHVYNNITCYPKGTVCGTIVNSCIGNADPAMNPGMPNISVQLLNNLGGLLSTVVSDNYGNFCFPPQNPGTYTVQQSNITNQTFPATGANYTFTVTPGSHQITNFANCFSTIKGKKYNDVNCNGLYDANDVPMAGWQIKLKDNFGTVIATTTTNAAGNYFFNGLGAGINYNVSEVNQAGWSQTSPTATGHNVTLTAGQIVSKDFFNCIDPCIINPGISFTSNFCMFMFKPVLPSYINQSQVAYVHWDFGDGNTSTELNPYHFYDALGSYIVELDITFYNGSSCCKKNVEIKVDVRELCKEYCKYDADIAFNSDGCFYNFYPDMYFVGWPIANIHWDFGDGTTGSGFNVSHSYLLGTYNVCMTIIAKPNKNADEECCTYKVCRLINVSKEGCCVEDRARAQVNNRINFNSDNFAENKLDYYENKTNQINESKSSELIYLDQNNPNPFQENSQINFYIPLKVKDAKILIKNLEGKIIKAVQINKREEGSITIYGSDINDGIYIYNLVLDDVVYESKKMVKN